MTSMDYASLGNVAHLLCLASTLGYAIAVVTRIGMFDPSWRQDGFCVTNKEQDYLNSHDMCLYYDTVASVVLAAVCYTLKGAKGMEFADKHFPPAIIGILAHGIGHGAIARQIRVGELGDDLSKTGWDIIEGMDAQTLLVRLIPGIVFWVGMLKAAMSNVKLPMVMLASLLVQLAEQYVPILYGFTYVQSVLLLCFSFNELAQSKNEKGFSYALYPMVAGFPVTLVGWLESTQCSAFVKDYFYGHLIYDGYIPVGVLVWYLGSYAHATTFIKKVKTV